MVESVPCRLASLCDSLKGSSIEELVLNDVGMGAKGVALLADAIKFAAALTKLDIRDNPSIDGNALHALKLAARDGCEVLS